MQVNRLTRVGGSSIGTKKKMYTLSLMIWFICTVIFACKGENRSTSPLGQWTRFGPVSDLFRTCFLDRFPHLRIDRSFPFRTCGRVDANGLRICGNPAPIRSRFGAGLPRSQPGRDRFFCEMARFSSDFLRGGTDFLRIRTPEKLVELPLNLSQRGSPALSPAFT